MFVIIAKLCMIPWINFIKSYSVAVCGSKEEEKIKCSRILLYDLCNSRRRCCLCGVDNNDKNTTECKIALNVNKHLNFACIIAYCVRARVNMQQQNQFIHTRTQLILMRSTVMTLPMNIVIIGFSIALNACYFCAQCTHARYANRMHSHDNCRYRHTNYVAPRLA